MFNKKVCLKIHVYSPKQKSSKCFLLLCSPVNLSKHNIYTLTRRFEQFSVVFIAYNSMQSFCYLVEYPIHACSEQVKCCLFLQCFDVFVDQAKEIMMYWKWNTALLADLIWTCGQHLLFCIIFGCCCYMYLHLCVCTNYNINLLLIS